MADTKKRYDRRYLAAVDAAAAVFADKGFHGAATADIAEKLEIKQGSLYYYFKSKEAALEAVCLEGIRHQVSYLESLYEANLPLQQTIRQLLDYILNSLKERANYMLVFDNERQSIPIENRGKIRQQSHIYHKLLEKLFSRAQQQGELKAHLDVYVSVRAFTGLITSISSWYHREQEIDLSDVARQFSDIFLDGSLANRR
ncbi:hypothetical protein GZ77_07460 [Endozoicomonas montiporae]|uniref:HTH tetR-type domain-containing protein n=2 Tax=Endozoicomonas montiporae TaxID=1027273 RepID=A0A081N723_9GAMM|nr:TetR/AcrR family transcriptional regulator [Endozoicomonas montiporae]AMO55939.1 TetR family transcriptional regulator [Endozoicomonas montiporae CL-33]KEQ14246.1 hypothetical protein GZ77_07460 [Endozoicomonas montiporae]